MTKTYSASCHCGAVRFRFRSEEFTRGLRCNCSICIRKGAVMSCAWVPDEDFEELVGLDALAVYRFGDHDVNHWFCRTCGIYPFHDSPKKPGRRINLGCVHDFDVLALPFDVVDGRSF